MKVVDSVKVDSGAILQSVSNGINSVKVSVTNTVTGMAGLTHKAFIKSTEEDAFISQTLPQSQDDMYFAESGAETTTAGLAVAILASTLIL